MTVLIIQRKVARMWLFSSQADFKLAVMSAILNNNYLCWYKFFKVGRYKKLKNLENKFKIGLNSTQQLPASAKYNSLSVNWSMPIKKPRSVSYSSPPKKHDFIFFYLNKIEFLQHCNWGGATLHSLKYWGTEKVMNTFMHFNCTLFLK